MLLDLHTILDYFSTVSVYRYWGAVEAQEYTDAVWMGVFDGYYQKNCIYIGFLSQFLERLPPPTATILMVNDIGGEETCLGGTGAELAANTQPAELCFQVRERFFPNRDIPDITQTLLSGLFINCSINEIIDVAFVHLNNPIMVSFSHNHKNFYYSCGKEQQFEFNISDAALRERESAIGYTEWRENIQQELQLLRPIIVENGDFFKGNRRILAPITQGLLSRKQLGIMAVFEVNQPLDDRAFSMIRIISQLLSEKCASPSFRETLTSFSVEQHIQELLQGQLSDIDLTWAPRLFGAPPYDLSLTMVDVRTMDAYRNEAIQYRLPRSIRADITLMRGSYLIAITNLARRDIADYMQRLQDLAVSDHIIIACSNRFGDLRQLRRYYSQTKLLLRYARRAEVRDLVCDFPKLRTRVLIDELSERTDLELFTCDDLERLIEFDRENHCEYYQTLTTWLRSGMNRETVRRELCIHRNTLAYRLERIEELLGVKLTDNDVLLNLYLSIAIRDQLQLMKRKKSSS